jgi:hypothetical protein
MYGKRLFGLELTTPFYRKANQEQIPADWFEISIENFMSVSFLLDYVLEYGIYDFNRTLAFFIVISRLFSSFRKNNRSSLINNKLVYISIYSLTGHV